jgi:hypothetical protein
MKNILSVLLALGLLGTLLYGTFKTLSWLYNHILAVDPRISAALITGLIAIIATSLTITIPKYLEKKMEIEEHLREKKSETYRDLVELLFKLLMGSKTGNSLSEEELIKAMSKFTENLILWGSEDVIKAYKSFRDYFIQRTSGQELSLESIQIMEELLLSIRKDMGHNNKNLDKGDILSLFINDLDKVLDRLKVS